MYSFCCHHSKPEENVDLWEKILGHNSFVKYSFFLIVIVTAYGHESNFDSLYFFIS